LKRKISEGKASQLMLIVPQHLSEETEENVKISPMTAYILVERQNQADP